jgi:hypothetical protein
MVNANRMPHLKQIGYVRIKANLKMGNPQILFIQTDKPLVWALDNRTGEQCVLFDEGVRLYIKKGMIDFVQKKRSTAIFEIVVVDINNVREELRKYI